MSTARFSVLVRNFSTSNVSNQMIRPPIQVFGLEGRYACALYSAATKQKKANDVEKELINFQTSLKNDAKLREFFVNPIIKRSMKSDAIKQMSSKISLSPTSSNLLQLLAENGRLKKFDAIVNAFKIIMAAERGEVMCEVTTAKALDSAMQQQLEKTLKQFMKPNEKILLTTKVDPNILGGMLVSIGDKFVDMSVASKIKKYTDVISAAI